MSRAFDAEMAIDSLKLLLVVVIYKHK